MIKITSTQQHSRMLERLTSCTNMVQAGQWLRKRLPESQREKFDAALEYMDNNADALMQQLRSHTYVPALGNQGRGLWRLIDAVIQRGIVQTVAPCFEPLLGDVDNNYGGVPGRTPKQAIRRMADYAQDGYMYGAVMHLDMTLQEQHYDRMVGLLHRYIPDKHMVGLIKQYLHAGLLRRGLRANRLATGLDPLAQLLTNVYMCAVDRTMQERGVAYTRCYDQVVIQARSEAAIKRQIGNQYKLIVDWYRLHMDVMAAEDYSVYSEDCNYMGYHLVDGQSGVYSRAVPEDDTKLTLEEQIERSLTGDCNFAGYDKHKNKRKAEDEYILSTTTYNQYRGECLRCVHWVQSMHPDIVINTLDKLRPYVAEYIWRPMSDGTELSAWTRKTERAAIAKLYHCSCVEIADDLPLRRRADIKKGRGNRKTKSYYDPAKHPEAELVGKATGCRKCEMGRIYKGDILQQGGQWVARIWGKGGKLRYAEIDPDYVDDLLDLCDRTPDGERLIPKGQVPKGMNQHANRREYAQRCVARYSPATLDGVDPKDIYKCRGDRHDWYYRPALAIASRNLGHGSIDRRTGQWNDRTGVVVNNYMH